MGKKLIRAIKNIADGMDMPADIILNIPKVSLVGNSEITIENHKGIAVFEENILKVNTNIGAITITGKNFEILFIGGDTVVIGGMFYSLVFEEVL